MSFYVADFNSEFGKRLEKLVGDKCFFDVQSQRGNFEIRAIVTDPAISMVVMDDFSYEVNSYKKSLEIFRSRGVPVIFYSEFSIEALKENGFSENHYDKYFNKFYDSIEKVAKTLKIYLDFSVFNQVN